MSTDAILAAQILGMLTGVLIVLLYSLYRLRQIDKDWKEKTALVLEYMHKDHERRMRMMDLTNKQQGNDSSEIAP